MEAEGAQSDPPEPTAQPGEAAVTLPREELAWARARAEREGTTVAEVVAETVRKARQAEAWTDVEAWLREVNPEPTAEELEAVIREWRG